LGNAIPGRLIAEEPEFGVRVFTALINGLESFERVQIECLLRFRDTSAHGGNELSQRSGKCSGDLGDIVGHAPSPVLSARSIQAGRHSACAAVARPAQEHGDDTARVHSEIARCDLSDYALTVDFL